MKEIDTSTFDFPGIIGNGFLYVDKTAFLGRLIQKLKGEYFLSRPRRFGKSLLVSTLKAIFQGKRGLFKGLAIDKMDYDWKEYPVFHVDFANCEFSNAKEIKGFLLDMLDNFSREFDIPLRGQSYIAKFENIISDAAKTSQTGYAVVLIDEYDKPILGNIDNLKHRDSILKVLKGFYSCIKKCEGKIRFALITGVSKFAHVSVFSDLNNLTDITLNSDYAEMLGFTEAEIRQYFADRIPLAAEANGCQSAELMRQLLRWYDGYRFSDTDTHVCNPVSISKFFNEKYRFTNYWDATGTPSFLLKLSMKEAYDYEAAMNEYYSDSIFGAYELDKLDLTGLLWQTGYLTIKEVKQSPRGMRYRLGFPDLEVSDTFCLRLLEAYGKIDKARGDALIEKFQDAIEEDDLNGFMTRFQAFLGGINYEMHLPHEKYYQTIFYVVFRLLGTTIEAESYTNAGRIDAYIRTATHIYIFEFKLNKTAETAIGQILDRRYYEKFRDENLPITLVGVNFDSSKGQIDNWAETSVADK